VGFFAFENHGTIPGSYRSAIGIIAVAGKPRPSPCYLDNMDYMGFKNGQQLWRSSKGDRYYTWDSLHGEIEVYSKKGKHLGALDAVTGKLIKSAVRGRYIDV
jgi:hypothetical protein